jgi:arylsulfatase
MISRMDAEIGRIVAQLKVMDEYENTLILFVSDNGASAEQIIRGDGHYPEAEMGSAKSYLCLGPGWSTAANTPFRLHKHWNHEGGISSPLIVHWPAGIKAKGELRYDPSHFIDIAPTVLEVASGSRVLENYKSEDDPRRPGMSLVPAFAKNRTIEHESLWWCHHGNRAIRMGDWKLSSNGSGKKRICQMGAV